MALVIFLNTQFFGEVTSISFIDVTSVAVCHIKRAKAHKTLKGLADWGKSSGNDRIFNTGFPLQEEIKDDVASHHQSDCLYDSSRSFQ